MPNKVDLDQCFCAELRLKIFMFLHEKNPEMAIKGVLELAGPVEEWILGQDKEKSCQ